WQKIGVYWDLIKSKQTGLLVITGVAGFMSSSCPIMHGGNLAPLAGSLLLAISGSTVLNMWFDRDVDAKMKRTCWRPLPAGRVSPREVLLLGLILSAVGVGWAISIDRLFGLIVFVGLFIDVVIYTVWLKRRTAWSILWGGISGGVPILAGRVLGAGKIEWVGLLLLLAVLLWIPSHILTTNMRYLTDYRTAGIPTFPSVYGIRVTRRGIAISSGLASVAMVVSALGLGITSGCLYLLTILTFGLLLLAVFVFNKPSQQNNFGLFKFASVYMLCSMLLLVVGVY
ncbi:MAG: heme o synthase, partial [Chloroflexota bacterium]